MIRTIVSFQKFDTYRSKRQIIGFFFKYFYEKLYRYNDVRLWRNILFEINDALWPNLMRMRFGEHKKLIKLFDYFFFCKKLGSIEPNTIVKDSKCNWRRGKIESKFVQSFTAHMQINRQDIIYFVFSEIYSETLELFTQPEPYRTVSNRTEPHRTVSNRTEPHRTVPNKTRKSSTVLSN